MKAKNEEMALPELIGGFSPKERNNKGITNWEVIKFSHQK